MQETLDSILLDAQRTRLSITGSRLARLNTAECSQTERLEILYWLIVCNKKNAALKILHDIEKEELPPTALGKVYAALLRCDLQGFQTLPPVKQCFSAPRWVEAFHKIGNELAYPTEIEDLALALDSRKEVHVEVRLRCLACQSSLVTTAVCDLLPHAQPAKSHWICPHCLARCEYDPVQVRERIFEVFDTFFQTLPRDAQGYLSSFDAGKVLAYAVALRPFGLIRFLRLYSEKIGHFLINTSLYLSGKKMLGHEPSLDYLGIDPNRAVSNKALMELWGRFFSFSPAAGQISSMIPNKEHCPLLDVVLDRENALERYPVVFPFTVAENEKALQALERMGVPRGSKYVCWHCRTQDFVMHHYPEIDKDQWQLYRNVALPIFKKSIDYLISKGYYVLRMGTPLTAPLPWQSDKLIDYARNYRTEFMDIWLFAHADLTLGTCSGIDAIPCISGRNALFVSFAPAGYALTFSSKTTILFEHYHSTATQQRIPLQELYASGHVTDQLESEFREHGYYLVKNTEEEILHAVQEKVFLMEGGRRSEEDVQLEDAFWELFERNREVIIDKYSPSVPWQKRQLHGPRYFSHVSSVFLRQYRDELLRTL